MVDGIIRRHGLSGQLHVLNPPRGYGVGVCVNAGLTPKKSRWLIGNLMINHGILMDFGDKNMFSSELWWNYLCEFYGFWGYPMCQASGVPLGKESTDFVKHWIFEVPIGALCLGKTIFRRPNSSDRNWKIWTKTTKLNNIYIYINNWFTVHGLPTTHI